MIAICLPAELLAQHLSFHNYGSDEGLPQSQVNAVFQDSFGFIWVGTYAGAGRYDGTEFSIFDSSRGLRSNNVMDIEEDSRKRIYIATSGGGLCVYDSHRFHFYDEESGLVSNNVNDILIENDDKIWLACDGGITLLEDGVAKQYRFDDPSDPGFCLALYIDSKNRLWFGTEEGLYLFEEGKFIFQSFHAEPFDPQVNAVIEDSDGRLLVCSNAGLFQLEEERGGLFPVLIPNEYKVESFYCATPGADGAIWFGTSGGALRLDKDDFTLITRRQGLAHNEVNSIIVDREQNVWFGTEEGLSKLTHGPFSFYNRSTGLISDGVSDVYEDSRGRLWILSESEGINILDNGHLATLTKDDGLPGEAVYAVIELPSGEFLLGTYSGLFLWANGRSRPIETEFSVTCLVRDSLGRIWMDCDYDPAYWQNGEIHYLADKSAFDNATINCIREDNHGGIWFGTNRGCILLDGDSTTTYQASDGFTDHDVWSIDVDTNGRVWLGTNGDGAFYYEDGKFTQVTLEQGLRNNFVWQVLAASDGSVWLGTNNSLHRFDRDGKIRHYDTSDGLASNEGIQDACIEDSKGRLWFCSGKGISVYTKEADKRASYQPPVYLSTIVAADKELSPHEFHNLAANNNRLEFKFVGLSFKNERDVRFRYRLEGLEQEWSPPTRERNVRYANLPPGEFSFAVEACSADGAWSAAPAEFRFRILRPFYLEWWFVTLVFLTAIALVYLAHRRRMQSIQSANLILEEKVEERTQQLLTANKELEEFSRMVSHDLGTHLRHVEGFTEILQEECKQYSNENLDYLAGKIILSGKKMRVLINDLLKLSLSTHSSLKREEVNLNLIINGIVNELRVAEPERKVEFIVPPQLQAECSERLVRIVLENLIGNAWKYTTDNPVARIEIGSIVDNGATEFYVRDDGIGFDPSHSGEIFNAFIRLENEARFEGTGLGLATVKKIIDRHGGNIRAESTPGQGSTFYFTFG